jgi:hypothetical protein
VAEGQSVRENGEAAVFEMAERLRTMGGREDTPFCLHCCHNPFAVRLPRLVLPLAVVELRAANADPESVLSLVLTLHWRLIVLIPNDGVEPRGGRNNEPLVVAGKDEVTASEEHLAGARDDGGKACGCRHGVLRRCAAA